MLVARRLLVNFDARDHLVHPIANCSISIVVERIHASILKGPIWLLSIPSFPNCRCSLLHRVEPRWILLAIQQQIRLVKITVPAKHMADIWSTQEACGEVPSRSHVAGKAIGRDTPQLIRQQIELQRQRIGGLRIFTDALVQLANAFRVTPNDMDHSFSVRNRRGKLLSQDQTQSAHDAWVVAEG